MNIDLGGNTLINGYFAGIVVPPGPSYQWIVVSSPYTATAGDQIQADTSGGAFAITLPLTASIGDCILIQDAKLSWNINNLTINRNGLNLNGGTSNYVASVQGNKLSAVYVSTSYGWSIK
jgi:hypothetical protein